MNENSTKFIWVCILTIGMCSLILAAGSGVPHYYMAVTALISFTIAALGLRNTIALDKAGAPLSAVSASTARYMGLVYAWGALALFVTYYFILPEWREWPVFFGALALVAVVSLFFATALSNDVARGKDDPTLLKIGRILTIVQFAGTVVAVIGLLIDPDKQFLNTAKLDWAAQTVFLFGAIALAAISAAALFYTRDRQPAA
ncbi:MAG: hypothetical protein B7Y80_12160 [Hyphomicrobium sp. 32-62-53]|nr:MAG: hypothetical protein B7Z29_00750 [Hyphomicrobium sp. 12-62-95]OYX99257.1 MAG: hypothetical protein B7Y80_12160 [Hyphomicrobium sp. 32-62-53]